MGISNIERMVEAIVRDEMNFVKMMSMEELDQYVEDMVRSRLEAMDNDQIVELYEDLGD